MVVIRPHQQAMRLVAVRGVRTKTNGDSLAVRIDRVRQWSEWRCDDHHGDLSFVSQRRSDVSDCHSNLDATLGNEPLLGASRC
jgi:hypothetical protein